MSQTKICFVCKNEIEQEFYTVLDPAGKEFCKMHEDCFLYYDGGN